MKQLLLFIAVFFLGSFLFHYLITGQAVYGDGVGYYAYLHSWYFDHDWDSTNEYTHIYTPENNNALHPQSAPQVQIVHTTEGGKALNHFSPGTAVLLLPWYIVADGIVLLLPDSLQVARTGYGDMYQITVGVGGVLYVLLSVLLLTRILRFISVPPLISSLTLLFICLCTPLVYYGGFDVINSHAISALSAALILYVYTTVPFSLQKVLLLGMLVGYSASVRVQDVFLGVFLGAEIVQSNSSWYRTAVLFVSAVGALCLGMLPLLLQFTLGISLSEHTYTHELLRWFATPSFSGFWGSLFNADTGLLARTPALLPFFIYLGFVLKAHTVAARWYPSLIFVCIQYCIISMQGGWVAAAFGGRMYITSLIVLTPLMAEFVAVAQKRYGTSAVIAFVAVCVLGTFTSMAQFVLFRKATENGIPGTEVRTLQRLQKFLMRDS